MTQHSKLQLKSYWTVMMATEFKVNHVLQFKEQNNNDKETQNIWIIKFCIDKNKKFSLSIDQ